jgi:cytochrome c peroxidase
MPNPVEQNIDRQAVCQQVQSSKYAPLYKSVWGIDIDCSNTPVTISAPDMNPTINPSANPALYPESAFDISFKRLMLAVCAYQASNEVNSFSSKRDIALANETDGAFPLVGFTDQENLGHDLFYGTNESGLNNGGPGGRPKNARCAGCHLSDRANPDGTGQFERYADDGYHNIGIPLNTEIPFTGTDPDAGLFGHTGTILIRPPFPPGAPPQRLDPLGMHKTTTLRNVDKRPDPDFVKAYGHNGWFKSLESIVHFYNTAAMEEDLAPFGIPKLHNVTRCPPEITTEKDALANNCWPAPAYSNGIAIPFLVGNLGLTSEEEAAIVAYLKTFTDTFTPKQPAPYNAKKR